jgi:hypothetical protein
MRSEQRPDFLQQFGIAVAPLAQKFLLLPGWHLQRRLQQFINPFPAFGIHRSVHHVSRGSTLTGRISGRTPIYQQTRILVLAAD